jgi:hypothetical protein
MFGILNFCHHKVIFLTLLVLFAYFYFILWCKRQTDEKMIILYLSQKLFLFTGKIFELMWNKFPRSQPCCCLLNEKVKLDLKCHPSIYNSYFSCLHKCLPRDEIAPFPWAGTICAIHTTGVLFSFEKTIPEFTTNASDSPKKATRPAQDFENNIFENFISSKCSAHDLKMFTTFKDIQN